MMMMMMEALLVNHFLGFLPMSACGSAGWLSRNETHSYIMHYVLNIDVGSYPNFTGVNQSIVINYIRIINIIYELYTFRNISRCEYPPPVFCLGE